ncbi:hypothetical protein DFH09DRAFT_1086782 [Mycena vulgaris]|nr:hypothetical protein DFH09DRAFT_1086782 [Mycena vulgaris]
MTRGSKGGGLSRTSAPGRCTESPPQFILVHTPCYAACIRVSRAGVRRCQKICLKAPVQLGAPPWERPMSFDSTDIWSTAEAAGGKTFSRVARRVHQGQYYHLLKAKRFPLSQAELEEAPVCRISRLESVTRVYSYFSPTINNDGEFTFRLAKRACARANGLVWAWAWIWV